ncbi:MAG: hypothetical protein DWQ31_01945 [Planctomycetota bacterium]|nr:MAG: hypothetical protein DWQ31_01945 [Planctomycetota bacterium]REJ95423.1 MAG: hypothetical protein DWQ35_06775 [Planctomycetota bacterium]
MLVALSTIFAVAALAGMFWRRSRLAGTTLLAPWWWALLAVASVALVELGPRFAPSAAGWLGQSATRYTAYVAMLCPSMAILGAKRPQDRPWQAIVLSLWAILLVPVFSSLFFAGGQLRVESLWSWFLPILILVGLLNPLPTRQAIAGLLVALAQLVALGEFLPGVSTRLEDNESLGAWTSQYRTPLVLGLLAAAIAAVHLRARMTTARRRQIARQAAATSAELAGLSLVWRDFRDAFGSLWALRLAERVNDSATRYDWSVRLQWDGFEPVPPQKDRTPEDDRAAEVPELSNVPEPSKAVEPGGSSAPTAQTLTAIESSLRVLLRRFVSPEWIDARLATAAQTLASRDRP